MILPEVVALLLACGVSREDIVFICANGNHKKWSESELRAFVGEEIFHGFWPGGQIVNHDCLEPSGLIHLGETPSGCVVEHNRRFVEADLMIYVGQVMAHTWGRLHRHRRGHRDGFGRAASCRITTTVW